MTKKELTKDEKSLLMFFEYTAVDRWGWIDDVRKMNDDDIETMIKWNDEGFILSQRASRKRDEKIQLTYIVRLSEAAWELAHQLRKEKALRHIPDELSLDKIKGR